MVENKTEMSSSRGKAISNSQRGKLPSNHDSSGKSGLSIKNSEHDPSRHRSAASSKYKVNHRLVEETQSKAVAKQRWSILKEVIYTNVVDSSFFLFF